VEEGNIMLSLPILLIIENKMYGKRKKMMGGGMYSAPRKKKGHGGRTMYAYGGKVQMDGSQPKYKDDMPKCMPN